MNSKTVTAIVAGILLTATLAGIYRMQLSDSPLLSESGSKPLVCLDCHRSPNIRTNEGVATSQAFCLSCHQETTCIRLVDGNELSLQVTREKLFQQQPRHQFVACVQCHTDVARSPHQTRSGATCRECHSVHGESPVGDPHLRVSCQACHFQAPLVALDTRTDQVVLARRDASLLPVSLADHSLADVSDPKSCEKCHHDQNRVGAPASVLPSKSALCILCHNSPLAMGHPVFGVAMLILAFGILLTLRFWYQGSVQGEETSLHRKIALSSESIWEVVFSRRIFSIFKIILFDVLLQRRILKESMGRWSMHSLIYTAILIRCFLSIVTAVLFTMNPDGEWAMALIDKNHPFTAFANDLLGMMILAGILWALSRRFITKPGHVVSEYQDNIALGIIGSLVVLGFILEGVRILVTAVPVPAAMASFMGYPLSRIFALLDLPWASIYPILWYAHGVVAAVFIAYLPFGKMRHMFNTPLTYILEEVSGVKNEKRI